MNLGKTILAAGVLTITGLVGLYLTSCSSGVSEGMIVFTRVPEGNFEPAGGNMMPHHYTGAQIVAINPAKPGQPETVLTAEFYSACSPDLSYGADRMLFVAQQAEHGSWQVWEMDLGKGTSRQITDFQESCSHPAYLPGDRLVFSREFPNEGYGSWTVLFTMNLDGTGLKRITFQPHEDYTATILWDGRILMLTRQVYPDPGNLMYMAMRPNGTKTELFYQGGENSVLGNRVRETRDGTLYFIEWGNGTGHKADLLSVHQNRPLFTRRNLSEGLPGSIYSVFPMPSGDLLVSYSPSREQGAGLYRFPEGGDLPGEPVFECPGYHIIEPVLVEAYTRPRNLPDEVNMAEETGQLLCQNINVIGAGYHIKPVGDSIASSLEVLGLDRSMGIAPAAEDGSVYLKIVADTPFRLQTLDDEGHVVNGPSGWLWIRPFERRGCAGCHEDPELVPKNFVPLAVKNSPISIPVEGTQETTLSSAVNKTN